MELTIIIKTLNLIFMRINKRIPLTIEKRQINTFNNRKRKLPSNLIRNYLKRNVRVLKKTNNQRSKT